MATAEMRLADINAEMITIRKLPPALAESGHPMFPHLQTLTPCAYLWSG